MPYRMFFVEQMIARQAAAFPQFQEDASIEIAFVDVPLPNQQRKHDNIQNHPLLKSPKIVMIGKGDLHIKHLLSKHFPNFQKRIHDPERYYLPSELEKGSAALSPLERLLVERVRK